LISFATLNNISYKLNRNLIENNPNQKKNFCNQLNYPNLNDLELPDKVYTFLTPSDTLTFESLYLEKYYNYYIYIELVTPHNCTLQITIWDPDNKKFNIFESEMFYNPEYGRYFEIPFGTALSGNYKIQFSVQTNYNINIYIKIEQGSECLYDKIPSKEIKNLIFYKVNRFDSGMNVEHNILLETDMMYKFYIGRVSAISIKENNEVKIDYIIEDPDDIEFKIFSDYKIANIDNITIFYFGTAKEGLYSIKLTIYCSVSYVNIGYAILEDYEISENIDVNDTNPENQDNMNYFENLWNNSSFLPIEWLFGSVIFVGITISILLIILIQHRKKNEISLKN